MTTITATEFKQNLGHYFAKSAKEDIYITKNNKIIAKLTSPTARPKTSISDFFNTLPDINYTARDARLDRALRKN